LDINQSKLSENNKIIVTYLMPIILKERDKMYLSIKNVKPLDNYSLLLTFENEEKKYLM